MPNSNIAAVIEKIAPVAVGIACQGGGVDTFLNWAEISRHGDEIISTLLNSRDNTTRKSVSAGILPPTGKRIPSAFPVTPHLKMRISCRGMTATGSREVKAVSTASMS